MQANGNFRVFQFLIDHYVQQYGDSPGVRKKITPVVEKWAKIVICDVVLGLRAMGSAVWTQSKIEEKLHDQEAFTMALVPRILPRAAQVRGEVLDGVRLDGHGAILRRAAPAVKQVSRFVIMG